ncbi:hypothetical protein UK23_22490 [Lentzea aerocolonigenes]|uniref:Uncharacterized protein n=1 Tax=Lentzea aerocolonigenes TaxID=68170 RepID=A0A0F0GTI5_LENAE|nr:hypothetical protein [Lentzea aerocolonigenes]KJK46789.1 hypothetical protein UK23_22490 [Lentzea aerocolonigenes]
MDDLVAFMKERRRADEAAAAAWAARSATISAWAQKVATLLARHQIPAEQTLYDRVGEQKVRIASGWLVLTTRTQSAAHPGVLKDAGILLTPSGELWQYDNEWPMSARLTPAMPAFRTAEGAALKARCDWVLDNVIEAFADALERNGIDVAELEEL